MIILDDDTNKRLKFFECNYDIISKYYLRDIKDKSERIYLGNKNNKVCRFCGKTEPEVTFEKDAHAISNLLGNQMLFTYYECDKCNSKFGEKLETNLANFLGISRTYYGIKGKKEYLDMIKAILKYITITAKLY